MTERKAKRFNVHYLVLLAFVGNRNGRVIDHIDGNKKNNTLANLEYVSIRENSTRYTRKVWGEYTGAAYKCNKWYAAISVNGKIKHLGIFTTQAEAHNRYKEELNRLLSKENKVQNETRNDMASCRPLEPIGNINQQRD